MFYTYVIRSKKDNKCYTGTTSDLRKRLNEHNDNKVTSTKNRGPFELIYYEACIDMNDAFARERYLKTGMGKRYLKNRMRRFLSLTGQALLELAVFGSILIMLLGILVNYGLRYNYQQQVMQQAFRKALKSATEAPEHGKPSSVTNIVVKDRYIPNPSSPFSLGSTIPVSSSASVVRNYHMQDNVPDTYAELPQVTMNIQGREGSLKTAGFRDENNVTEDAIKKYKEIYGSSNVWVTGDGECLDLEIDQATRESTCIKPTKNIRIIDSSAGEIVNYDSAVKQCRQIVDRQACQKECERGKFPGSDTDCISICEPEINVPWYCERYDRRSNPAGSLYDYSYTFPVLNELFDFAIAANKPKNMGLQQDYTQKTRVENTSLNKVETTSGIQTTDVLDYKDTMQRKVIYNAGLDDAGVSKGEAHIIQYPVNTTTQFITCEKNLTDCVYGYKIVTCTGDDCGQSAGEKTWQTNW